MTEMGRQSLPCCLTSQALCILCASRKILINSNELLFGALNEVQIPKEETL